MSLELDNGKRYIKSFYVHLVQNCNLYIIYIQDISISCAIEKALPCKHLGGGVRIACLVSEYHSPSSVVPRSTMLPDKINCPSATKTIPSTLLSNQYATVMQNSVVQSYKIAPSLIAPSLLTVKDWIVGK
jgi:hypothetical protein